MEEVMNVLELNCWKCALRREGRMHAALRRSCAGSQLS